MPRPVHPVAALFPMLVGEDLQALADDIAERGLLQPIVLDSDGRVLHGRNRLAACELAGVDPTFTTYTGDDPAGYVLAANVTRRHLTKGQQAMLAAQARAVSGKPLSAVAAELGVSKTRVSYATTVLKHAPDLVADVVAGTMPLNVAYRQARAPKDAAAYDQAVSQAAAALFEVEASQWHAAETMAKDDDGGLLDWLMQPAQRSVAEMLAEDIGDEWPPPWTASDDALRQRLRLVLEAGMWALDDPSVRERPRSDVIAELSESGGRQSTRPTAQ